MLDVDQGQIQPVRVNSTSRRRGIGDLSNGELWGWGSTGTDGAKERVRVYAVVSVVRHGHSSKEEVLGKARSSQTGKP